LYWRNAGILVTMVGLAALAGVAQFGDAEALVSVPGEEPSLDDGPTGDTAPATIAVARSASGSPAPDILTTAGTPVDDEAVAAFRADRSTVRPPVSAIARAPKHGPPTSTVRA
jgi:hypothetical protein